MECGSVKRAEETEQVCQACEPSGQKGIPAGGDRDHRLTDPLLKWYHLLKRNNGREWL